MIRVYLMHFLYLLFSTGSFLFLHFKVHCLHPESSAVVHSSRFASLKVDHMCRIKSAFLWVTSPNHLTFPTAWLGKRLNNRCGRSNDGWAPVRSGPGRCEKLKLWLWWSRPSLIRCSSLLLRLPDMTPGRQFDALCGLLSCAFIAFLLRCFNTLLLCVSINITAQCNTLKRLSECSFFFSPSNLTKQHSGLFEALPACGTDPVLQLAGCVDAAIREEWTVASHIKPLYRHQGNTPGSMLSLTYSDSSCN